MENKSLKSAINEFNKKFDSPVIVSLKDEIDKRVDVESIDTGSLSLNEVFGCGGIPRGRIIELYGQQSSGKSTMALFLVSVIQKKGGKALWVDAEFSFSREYASSIGVNVDELYVVQPDNGEQALEAIRAMAETGEFDLIVLDSVAALVPKAELEGDIGDSQVALQARMMSKALRVLTGMLARQKTAVIFINQERDNIGVYWGNKTITPGGRALKFYASVRLEVKASDKIKDKEDGVIGNVLRICAVKNKVGAPFKTAELDLIYGKGIDVISDAFNIAEKKGIIKKVGNTYMLGDAKLEVGREHSKRFLARDEYSQLELSRLLKEDAQKNKKDVQAVREDEADKK